MARAERSVGMTVDMRIAEAREGVRVAQAAFDDALRELATAVGPPPDDAAAAGVSRAGYHSAEAGPVLEGKIQRLDDELRLALVELNDAERDKGAQMDRELRSRAGTITADERGTR
jgi:hypothetical protein